MIYHIGVELKYQTGKHSERVAIIDVEAATVSEALDRAYMLSQNTDRQWISNPEVHLTAYGRQRVGNSGGLRSTSVGDRLVVWEDLDIPYIVEEVGFTRHNVVES